MSDSQKKVRQYKSLLFLINLHKIKISNFMSLERQLLQLYKRENTTSKYGLFQKILRKMCSTFCSPFTYVHSIDILCKENQIKQIIYNCILAQNFLLKCTHKYKNETYTWRFPEIWHTLSQTQRSPLQNKIRDQSSLLCVS